MGCTCTDVREDPYSQQSHLAEKINVDANKQSLAIVEKNPLDEDIVNRDLVDEEGDISGKKVQQVLDVRKVEGEASIVKAPVREEKHIFKIAFTQPKLGIVLCSDINSNCAYVTIVDEEKNPMFKDVELPKYSKVLRVNGVDVEMSKFRRIVNCIKEGKEHLPVTITFCHPDGLGEDEVPESNPPTLTRSSSLLN